MPVLDVNLPKNFQEIGLQHRFEKKGGRFLLLVSIVWSNDTLNTYNVASFSSFPSHFLTY